MHNYFRNDREVRRYKSHHSLQHIKIFTLHQGRLTEDNITINRNAILWLFDFSSLKRHQRGMTELLHLTEEDKSIKSAKSLLEKLLGKVGCSMRKWQGVDSWDVIGPHYMPIRMLWMIWNIAEERKKKKHLEWHSALEEMRRKNIENLNLVLSRLIKHKGV